MSLLPPKSHSGHERDMRPKPATLSPVLVPMCWALAPGPVETSYFFLKYIISKIMLFFCTPLPCCHGPCLGPPRPLNQTTQAWGFEPSPPRRPWAPPEWLRLLPRAHFCPRDHREQPKGSLLKFPWPKRHYILLSFQTTFVIWRSLEGKWL